MTKQARRFDPQATHSQETSAVSVQRAASKEAPTHDIPASVSNAVRAPGQPLDTETRAFMESHFAHDFSAVRVHADGAAAESAQAINASAFTVGSDVVFDRGKYAPHSLEGRELLAHELTHVVQQNGNATQIHRQVEEQAQAAETPASELEGAPQVETESVDLSGLTETLQAEDLQAANAARETEMEVPIAAQLNGAPPAQVAHSIVAPDHASEQEAKTVSRWMASGALTARPAIHPYTHFRTLARQEGAKTNPVAGKPRRRLNLVFIMGKDKKKSGNKFYTAAHIYFDQKVPHDELIDDDNHRSLASVFEYLRQYNAREVAIGNLYLVAHANENGTLSFPLTDSDADKAMGSIDYPRIRDAVQKEPDLFQLPKGLVDGQTTVHIKGCNIGRSTAMLNELDRAFGGKETITAPTHKQYYKYEYEKKGGKTTITDTIEALKVYYLEYPGLKNLTRAQQLDEFASKYAFLSRKKWNTLVPKSGATRQVITAFSEPVPYEGEKGDEQLALSELKKINEPRITRPEMYEWRIVSKKPKKDGRVVFYAVAEKTNFTIDKIIADEAGKRLEPEESNALFFGKSDYQPPETAPTVSVKPETMSTSEILERINTVTAQIAQLASDDDEQRRDLSADKNALETEIKKRRFEIAVKVIKTEDWLGADEVYVRVTKSPLTITTKEVDLNDGQAHTFALPVSPFLPMSAPLDIQVFDADWPDRDDLIVQMTWRPPFPLITNQESFDKANYQVQVYFPK